MNKYIQLRNQKDNLEISIENWKKDIEYKKELIKRNKKDIHVLEKEMNALGEEDES